MEAEAQPQPPNGVPDDQTVLIIGSGGSIETSKDAPKRNCCHARAME